MKRLSDADAPLAKKNKKAIKLHTEMHDLADQLSELCNEPKRFGTFLGRIKTVGLPVAYRAFSELKEGMGRGEIDSPGRWWMWRSKSLTKKP